MFFYFVYIILCHIVGIYYYDLSNYLHNKPLLNGYNDNLF